MSIGMFDGLHLGHRAIVDQAAGPDGRTVVTFDPAPAAILNPPKIPRLMTADQRTRARGRVDEVVTLESTGRSWHVAGSFLERMVERNHPDHIVEGGDFRFGAARAGDLDLLIAHGERLGFQVHRTPEIEATLPDGSSVPARSSVVRTMLIEGRVEEAACLLARPWRVEAQVNKGHQRGRDIGCPTANLDLGQLVHPADGVYAGHAWLESGDRYMAAISIGTNPTFDDEAPSFEVHLLDFEGRIGEYGWTLKVDLQHRLRDQAVYETIDELVEAIEGAFAASFERVES